MPFELDSGPVEFPRFLCAFGGRFQSVLLRFCLIVHISRLFVRAMEVVSDAPAPAAAPAKSLGIIYPPPELRGA